MWKGGAWAATASEDKICYLFHCIVDCRTCEMWITEIMVVVVRLISPSDEWLYCRLCLLNKLLEDGNILYKRTKLPDAALRYNYALKRIPQPTPKDVPQAQNTKIDARFNKVFDQLRIHLLLNLSRYENNKTL